MFNKYFSDFMLQMHELLYANLTDREVLHIKKVHNNDIVWGITGKSIYSLSKESMLKKMCSQARSTWLCKIAHAEQYGSLARYSRGRWCALEMRDANVSIRGVSGAALSRCGFQSCHYLEVKMLVKKRSGSRSVSAVRSLEVVASRKLAMYYKYGILIRDLKICPL